MRRFVLTAAVLGAALLAGGFTQPPVWPEHTLRYTRERGGSCTVMVPYYGPQVLTIGRFAGGRRLDNSAERIFMDWRAETSCFFETADCERWLDILKQRFPDGAGYAYCRAATDIPDNPPPRSGGRKVVKP